MLTVILFSGIAFSLVGPQILRYFIDTARAGGAARSLMNAALLFLGVSVAQQVSTVLETYISESIAWTATNQMRYDLAIRCLELDISFHNEYSPGELMERIDGDGAALGNFFSKFVIQILGSFLVCIGVLLLLYREDWRIGLTMTLFAIVVLVTLNHFRDIATPHWIAAREESARLAGFLEERLAGTVDIRSNGATSYVLRRFFDITRNLMARVRKASIKGHLSAVVSHFSLTLGWALGLGLASYLYHRNLITIGTVYLISSYTGALALPIEQVTSQIGDLQQVNASILRIMEIFEKPIAITDGRGVTFQPDALSVEFDHVTFAYGEEVALRDLSFRLEAGQTLGLLGRTGSGKTSVARLLFRLYDPTRGIIRISSTDIRTARLKDLRQQIGMVTQDVQLFHASVRDNLTFFNRSIMDEKIIDVIKKLGLLPWYHSLPCGLDTILASASEISAGEAQLLALTRVFLQDPGIVVLDEASSRLDPATERMITFAIYKLLENRTGIIIAHRLETIQHVDKIMVLDHGQVREYGSREQLGEDSSSRYHQLVRVGIDEELA